MVQEIEDLKKALSEKTLEAEQLIREAEAAHQSKARYLSTISHGIRAPLSGIIGLSELMLQEKLSPEHKVWVRLMNSSAKETQCLLTNLLDFSKIERGVMEVESAIFNVAETREEIHLYFDPIVQAQGISFECRLEEGFEPWRVGDAYKLRQILTNLISNAIKFTNKGRICLRIGGDTTAMSVEVKDTGVGMSEDEIAHLFESYSQKDNDSKVNYGGTGLRLSICKMFCEFLSGGIEVDNEKGKGTCYRVSLPFEARPPHGP